MNQLVPIGNSPNQTLTTSLNVDGVVTGYQLTLRYNEIAGYWAMTVADAQGNLLLDSIPLITGNSPAGNILGQFAYLGIGSAYILNAGSVPFPDYPNALDLGSDFFLIWGDTPTPSGSTLQEDSEGFAIASLHIIEQPHPIGGRRTFLCTVTLKGPSPIVVGNIVNFQGLTGAPWLNGSSLTVVLVSGLTFNVQAFNNAGSIYGPAAETGSVTLI